MIYNWFKSKHIVFIISLFILVAACDDSTSEGQIQSTDEQDWADTGTGPEDTGTGPEDTGTGPEDTGTGPEDTGTGPEDTGTGPEDTGVPTEFDLSAGPVGFASLNGGVQGGMGSNPSILDYTKGDIEPPLREALFSGEWDGGIIVYIDNGTDLYTALSEQERHQRQTDDVVPLTIYINGTITQENSSNSKIDMKRQQRVSIIGEGSSGVFDGIGITLNEAKNVIISNLSIHHVRAGSGTCIEITEGSENIWVVHNEFYSDDPAIQTDKDFYDGLVDIKRESRYITVAWNKLRDHWKAMLLGHTDDESLAPDFVTYHNNYFYNLNTRLPLIRYATVHLFNNYFHDIGSSAINCRGGSQVRIENNYFENTGSGTIDTHADQVQGAWGWWYGTSTTGYWHVSGNTLVNTQVHNIESTTTVNIPYSYSAAQASAARDDVSAKAGRTF